MCDVGMCVACAYVRVLWFVCVVFEWSVFVVVFVRIVCVCVMCV